MFHTWFPKMDLVSVLFSEFQYSTLLQIVEDVYGTYRNENGIVGRLVMTIQRDALDCDYPLLKGVVFENDPQLNQGPTCYHSIEWNTNQTVKEIRTLFNAKFPGKTFTSIQRTIPLSPTLMQLTVNYLGVYGYSDVWSGDIHVAQTSDCQGMSIVSPIMNPQYQAWSG